MEIGAVGEAKQRRAEREAIIWHHTSITRTNLIWMSGVIELEGRSKGALHPAFGEIFTDATQRRPMRDFPAVAWFTSEIDVPKCLQTYAVMTVNKETGEHERRDVTGAEAALFTMNRMALGFVPAAIGAVRWPDHYGYHTPEGRELNETARELGDDPDRWWLTEQPADVMQITAARGSSTPWGLKMDRMDEYVPEIRKMVQLCRSITGAYIPPTWVGSAVHKEFIRQGKVHPDCRHFGAIAG